MIHIETLSAFAVGSVDGPTTQWQAFAFDLRRIHQPIASATVRIQTREVPPATTLCLGYDGQEVLQTIRFPRTSRLQQRRIELSAAATAALNASRGGPFYLDAWTEGGLRLTFTGFDLALCAAHATRKAA